MDFEDLELQEFIEFVFTNNIQPPNSIPITFYDPEQPNISLEDLFTIFSIILTEGMKIKFGNVINLNNLDQQDFIMIINYFKSFGITFIPIKIKLNQDKTINTQEVYHYNENDFNRVFPRNCRTCEEIKNLIEEILIFGNNQEPKLINYHLHVKTREYLYRFLFHIN